MYVLRYEGMGGYSHLMLIFEMMEILILGMVVILSVRLRLTGREGIFLDLHRVENCVNNLFVNVELFWLQMCVLSEMKGMISRVGFELSLELWW